MATRTKSAPIIEHTPVAAVAAGAVVVVGTIVAVATHAIAAGKRGTLDPMFQGTFPKGSGEITAGAVVYWDADPGVMTTTSTDNTLAGKCVKTAASAATEVEVVLTTV
jgi:predicted RecA/RadA family phage recombinase